jgi:hypothetical protein
MDDDRYTSFSGPRQLATGSLRETLAATKVALDAGTAESLLIFHDGTGQQVDFDFTGTLDEVLEREAPQRHARPGRPKLGVTSREVSLLPRHWEWLEQQPSGASAALRRLVEEARKRDPEGERARLAVEAASRVMTSLAGDRPNYEEASRALFARDGARFSALIAEWPVDVRAHLERLVAGSLRAPFPAPSSPIKEA